MTVVARTFTSIPERSASDTWKSIVELLAPDSRSAARTELVAVAGVACSCIADEALTSDPLVVYGAGPRLRIYAVYGDDATEGDNVDESPLSYVPTDGDWRMSIPCQSDDLEWVRRNLSATSMRVTARQLGAAVQGDSDRGAENSPASNTDEGHFVVDRNAFFRR